MPGPHGGPELGESVHYVAHGSPDGTYPRACRAAIVTELDDTAPLTARMTPNLFVMNPTGTHHPHGVKYEALVDDFPSGGTWHWPAEHETPRAVRAKRTFPSEGTLF